MLLLIVIKLEFLGLLMPIDPSSNVKFDACLFPSFLYILGVVAPSLLSQDIALIYKKRIDMCFVGKEMKLPKIMHRFTFVFFAVFCP
jgi:hypothetical protein